MKKLASILVALLMVLSVIPLAIAQEDGTATSDEDTSDSATEQTSGETSEVNEVETTATETAEESAPEVTEETTGEVTPEETVEATSEESAETSEEQTGEMPAEETTEVPAEEVPAEVEEEAGITPDSPLHGIERALERIDLLLTFGKSAKAKKGLAHARERLMEVQVMRAEKKAEAAAKAAEEYEEIVSEVQENVEAIGDSDATGELQTVVEVQSELEAQEAIVNKILEGVVSGEFKLKLKPLSDSIKKVQVAVVGKGDKARIKVKALGKSDAEVEELETEIRQKVSEEMGIAVSKPKAVKVERNLETATTKGKKATTMPESETGTAVAVEPASDSDVTEASTGEVDGMSQENSDESKGKGRSGY